MITKEIAQQALDALENYTTASGGFCVCCDGESLCKKDCQINNTITALRAATSQPAPTDSTQAFEAYAAQFDTLGDTWQDMGADEYFEAGWSAAKAIAQGEGEPVGYLLRGTWDFVPGQEPPDDVCDAVYMVPVHDYVPLSDERIESICRYIEPSLDGPIAYDRLIARAIEAAHGIVK